MDKKPVGRPAMNPDEKRKPRSIKMTDEEWRQLQKLAEEEEKSVAEYIRKHKKPGSAPVIFLTFFNLGIAF